MDILIQSQFEKFVISNYGKSLWECVIKECTRYSQEPTISQGDSYLVKLVHKTVEKIDATLEEILIKFGRYISRIMIAVCGGYIKEDWRTLDVLEHIEILRSLVLKKYISHDAQPLRMRVRRISSQKLEVIYIANSAFAHLGRGIINGVSSYYNEEQSLHVNMNIRKSGTIMIQISLKK